MSSSAGDKQIFDFVIDYSRLFVRCTDTSYTKVFINTTTTGGITHFLGFDVSLANHTCVAVRI